VSKSGAACDIVSSARQVKPGARIAHAASQHNTISTDRASLSPALPEFNFATEGSRVIKQAALE
jgi:hypothetical protein